MEHREQKGPAIITFTSIPRKPNFLLPHLQTASEAADQEYEPLETIADLNLSTPCEKRDPLPNLEISWSDYSFSLIVYFGIKYVLSGLLLLLI